MHQNAGLARKEHRTSPARKEHRASSTERTLQELPKNGTRRGSSLVTIKGPNTTSSLWNQPLDSTGQREKNWQGERPNSSTAGTGSIHHSTDAELVRKEQTDYVRKLATITWTSGRELARITSEGIRLGEHQADKTKFTQGADHPKRRTTSSIRAP